MSMSKMSSIILNVRKHYTRMNRKLNRKIRESVRIETK